LGFNVLLVSGFVKEVVATPCWVTRIGWPPPKTQSKPCQPFNKAADSGLLGFKRYLVSGFIKEVVAVS